VHDNYANSQVYVNGSLYIPPNPGNDSPHGMNIDTWNPDWFRTIVGFEDIWWNNKLPDKDTTPVVPVTRVEINSLNGTTIILVTGSVTLTATITPSSAIQGVTWSSSDDNIATVTQNGRVTGVNPGYAVIKGTSVVDNEKFGEITITVSDDVPVITIDTDPMSTTFNTTDDIKGSLNVVASVIPVATLSYQWYENTVDDNNNGTVIANQVNPDFTIPTNLVPGSYYYFVEVRAPGAESKRSKVATIIILADIVP